MTILAVATPANIPSIVSRKRLARETKATLTGSKLPSRLNRMRQPDAPEGTGKGLQRALAVGRAKPETSTRRARQVTRPENL